MHPTLNNIKTTLRTALILLGLILFLVYGGKAIDQANNWQAVAGKRHILGLPGAVTTAVLMTSNPNNLRAQPLAVVCPAKPAATDNAADISVASVQLSAPTTSDNQPALQAPANGNGNPDSPAQANLQNGTENSTLHVVNSAIDKANGNAYGLSHKLQ